ELESSGSEAFLAIGTPRLRRWYNADTMVGDHGGFCTSSTRIGQMKAHAQREARLQLIANMLEGQPWQKAMTDAGLSIGRSTAYRLVQHVRDPERSEQPFPDDRHGHPYKLTEPILRWMVEYCTQHPGVYSSQVNAVLGPRVGV